MHAWMSSCTPLSQLIAFSALFMIEDNVLKGLKNSNTASASSCTDFKGLSAFELGFMRVCLRVY